MQDYSRKSWNVKTSTEKQWLRNLKSKKRSKKDYFGSTVVSSALEHLKQTYRGSQSKPIRSEDKKMARSMGWAVESKREWI